MARNIYTESARDIIVSPATPDGVGAIAVVRVSGNGCHRVVQKIFSRDLAETDPGRLVLGRLVDGSSGEEVDQCLVCLWQEPRSYTGEDMAEFHLHGSPAVVGRTLRILVEAGARLARGGEFTRRAYLNGKLDLAQAEAVADLTQSQTEEARRAALHQLGGGLSDVVDAIRKDLIAVTAELEAYIDYPEEDIPAPDRDRQQGILDHVHTRMKEIMATHERGRLLQSGARVVLAGAPNAGKSSLFNALLRRERAIVTPHAGTTRDTIEATVDLAGIPLTLVDTAGLRSNPEEIEALGIEKTRAAIHGATLILFVVDLAEPTDEQLREYEQLRAYPHLVVLNKADTVTDAARIDEMAVPFCRHGNRSMVLSVAKREGLAELEREILQWFGARKGEGASELVLTSARHAEAIRRAMAALEAVREQLAQGGGAVELVAIDLQTALSEIDSITGREGLDEDILDAVFSTFCLGK